MLSAIGLYAQDGLPAQPEDGKCYAKCVTPDVFEDSIVRILVQPAYKRVDIQPASYRTVEEQVLIKPASKSFTYVPATYRTVRDTIVSKESYNRLARTDASFTTSSQLVTLKPAIGRWELGGVVPDCESADPNDCRTMCYKEYPAITTSIPVRVLQNDEGASASRVRPVTSIVTRQEEVTPARVEEIVIPAKQQTITRQVLVNDETTTYTDVPAVYENVTTQRLVKKGGLSYWREIACSLPETGEILPINYELGSASLTANSKRIIDEKLYQFLLSYPDAVIEVSAHTDARGSASSNQNLSRRRAQSVVNYLVSRGISRSRLVAKGYGEKQLLNNCADGVECSETEHRINRRTEFRVLSY